MINELKETHNQNVDQQNGFHHLLDEMFIPYQEDERRLVVGQAVTQSGWVLILSAEVDLAADLIRKVCPVLYEYGVSFNIVKDYTLAMQRNDFWHGADEVGNIITVFTIEEKMTKSVVDLLMPLTQSFWGPEVNKSVRLSEIIYVSFISYKERYDTDGNVVFAPIIEPLNPKKIPFKVDRKYQYWKRKRLLKKRYVPLVMLSSSPKGDLLKSIDLKGLKFNWCFIKEGKYHVFSDRHGRSIKDRLKWQAKVLKDLERYVPVPKFIDYFEQGEESYLVMELLEGTDFHRKIERVYVNRKWGDLLEEDRCLLIKYYLDVLQIIGKMHLRGYVHRDATATNFMILNSGELYAIDLELSYSLNEKVPDPPYTLGVFGYASPEQLQLKTPTVKEDVYTMGALLLHVLTGAHPSYFINRNSEVDQEKVSNLVEVPAMLEIMLKCFNVDPTKRPELSEIEQSVKVNFQLNK